MPQRRKKIQNKKPIPIFVHDFENMIPSRKEAYLGLGWDRSPIKCSRHTVCHLIYLSILGVCLS